MRERLEEGDREIREIRERDFENSAFAWFAWFAVPSALADMTNASKFSCLSADLSVASTFDLK